MGGEIGGVVGRGGILGVEEDTLQYGEDRDRRGRSSRQWKDRIKEEHKQIEISRHFKTILSFLEMQLSRSDEACSMCITSIGSKYAIGRRVEVTCLAPCHVTRRFLN